MTKYPTRIRGGGGLDTFTVLVSCIWVFVLNAFMCICAFYYPGQGTVNSAYTQSQSVLFFSTLKGKLPSKIENVFLFRVDRFDVYVANFCETSATKTSAFSGL